jgi:hypothetical protein
MKTPRRGFTSVNLLPVLLCASIGFLAIGHYVVQQLTFGRISRAKYAALLAAESCVDSAVQAISTNNNFAGENINLPATNLLPFASCSSVVTRTNSTTWRVYSTGTYRDGTRARVVAMVRGLRQNLGSAAILANGNIAISGNVDIGTSPSGLHSADVLSNGNITIDGSALIDGNVGAVGSVQMNSAQAVSVHNGIDPIYFPPRTTVNNWKTSWVSAAQQGGTVTGGISAPTTITGNKYIDGDVTLGSTSVLQLRGPGTVVVRGNVSLTGSARIVSSVELVVLGTFTMAGQSTYSVSWPGSGTTPGLWIYGNDPSNSATVTTTLLGGSSLDSQGIVTVLGGSMRLTGSSAFRGAVAVIQGSAEVATSGTYLQTYLPNLVTSKPNPGSAIRYAMTEMAEIAP